MRGKLGLSVKRKKRVKRKRKRKIRITCPSMRAKMATNR